MQKHVAFFGDLSSFTHQAAIIHFGENCNFLPYRYIKDVITAVENSTTKYGVIPIENSTEGAVNSTLDALAESEIQIIGEINLPIIHNLMGNCKISEIKKIYSHQQALAQCSNFLQKNVPNATTIETLNTTTGAKKALEEKDAAAIGSKLTSHFFNLPILSEKIQDIDGNTTRFIIISKEKESVTKIAKTSILLCLKHESGSLYNALSPFKKFGINLTMIESRPAKKHSWEYLFFIDFLGSIEDEKIKEMFKELEKVSLSIKILGSFPINSL